MQFLFLRRYLSFAPYIVEQIPKYLGTRGESLFFRCDFFRNSSIFIQICINHQKRSYVPNKTVRIEIKGTEFGGTFFLQPDRPRFFRASARKTKNKHSSHGARAIQWASAAMALSSACGLSAPIPLERAR